MSINYSYSYYLKNKVFFGYGNPKKGRKKFLKIGTGLFASQQISSFQIFL